MNGVVDARSISVVPCAEWGTKSDHTRVVMLDQLLASAKHQLKNVFNTPWTKIRRLDERLVFHFPVQGMDRAMEALARVPGILRLHPCVETQASIHAITRKLDAVNPERRTPVMARAFGSNHDKEGLIETIQREFLGNGTSKDVPIIHVDVFRDFAYIHDSTIQGLNGLPAGNQNPVLADITCLDEEAIASVLAARRGIVVTPVYFHAASLTGPHDGHERFLERCKALVGMYHAYPRLVSFDVDLDGLTRRMHGCTVSLPSDKPCIACMAIRQAVLEHLIARQRMAPFVVRATTARVKRERDTNDPGDMVPGTLFPTRPVMPVIPAVLAKDASQILGMEGDDARGGCHCQHASNRCDDIVIPAGTDAWLAKVKQDVAVLASKHLVMREETWGKEERFKKG